MDEIFGGADYSHVEDVGLAAKHAKDNEKVENRDDDDVSKEDIHHSTKV